MYLLSVAIVAFGAAPQGVCPADWRGARLKDALAEMAGKLEVPYVIDSSVTPADLETPVRLAVRHLTCEQALRWLARSAGLEAVIVDRGPAEGADAKPPQRTILVGRAERMPVAWRRLQSRPERPSPELRTPKSDSLADIAWVDTPLSRVAMDISNAFGVDVIFHPSILQDSPLIQWSQEQADLETVCKALTEKLGAVRTAMDGAIWIHPASVVASRPAASVPAPEVSPTLREPPLTAKSPSRHPVLEKRLRIDRSVTSWSQFAERVQEVTGVPCRLRNDPPARPFSEFEAEGTVDEILEAARLAGWITWGVQTADAGGLSAMQVSVRQRPEPQQK